MFSLYNAFGAIFLTSQMMDGSSFLLIGIVHSHFYLFLFNVLIMPSLVGQIIKDWVLNLS